MLYCTFSSYALSCSIHKPHENVTPTIHPMWICHFLVGMCLALLQCFVILCMYLLRSGKSRVSKEAWMSSIKAHPTPLGTTTFLVLNEFYIMHVFHSQFQESSFYCLCIPSFSGHAHVTCDGWRLQAYGWRYVGIGVSWSKTNSQFRRWVINHDIQSFPSLHSSPFWNLEHDWHARELTPINFNL